MPLPSASVLAELPEARASGQLAAIFSDLRTLCATPVVALIFRHLATHPGLLEQIWASLRPLMAAGAVQEAAWRISASHIPENLVRPLPRDVRQSLGVGETTLPALLNAIDAYNRANPINLLVMLTLLKRIELGAMPPVEFPAQAWRPPTPIAKTISRMIAPEDMTNPIRQLVNKIGFGDRTAQDPVVPSLLRHVAGDPALLATLHASLEPKFADGTLSKLTAALHAEMQETATKLARYLAPLPLLAAQPTVQATMRDFTRSWIPLMTIVGPAFARALRA